MRIGLKQLAQPQDLRQMRKTEGEPLGHEWAHATCTEPKTCSRCGETEGEPLDHETGEWIDEGIDYLTATRTMAIRCTRCSQILDSNESPVTSFLSEDVFLFPPMIYHVTLTAPFRQLIPLLKPQQEL